jgi:outer membrane protein assembly factor BamB
MVEPAMEQTDSGLAAHGGGTRWRRLAAVVSALAVLAGGTVLFSRLDLERHHYDRERLVRLAVASLPSFTPNNAASADWPQWRGPHRDGLSPETELLTDWRSTAGRGEPAGGPPILWKQPVGRGFSSVAVANGRLFTMEQETPPDDGAENKGPTQEAIVCRDAADGHEIWRFRYPGVFTERFGSGPRSTPAVDGPFVYAVGATGIFHCLRTNTGAMVWRHDLLEEFQGRPMRYGVSFSPLVEGNLVIATPGGPDGNCVVAFDKRSGAVVWKALDDPMGYSSPIAVTAAGVRQLLVFTNTALVSLTPADGKLLWRYPWETDNGFNIATPLAFGNYVFISSAYRKGCALLEVSAEADGSLQPHLVWEHNRMRNYFASSVLWDEHLYGFDEMDLVCLNVRTGEPVWREKGARTFRKGSLLIAAGHLLVLGEGGKLTLAEASPAGYHEKASCRVSEHKCWTVPALAGRRLYVRDESQLLCLDLNP